MKKNIVSFIFSLLVFCEVYSQNVAAFSVCPNQSISLGNDITICEGDSVTLSATGVYDRIVWNTGASASSIKVKTSGTYIVHGLKAATVDLVTNGDFHDTLTTFTSDYRTANGNQPYNRIVNPNYFKIVPRTGDAYWDFDPNCADHTSGNGSSNMLAVNGYTGLNKKIWCQTVPVQAGKNYNLSAWATSMAGAGKVTSNPAKLQFKINNVSVGATLNLPGTECSWRNMTAVWPSGVATSAEICIYNNVFTNAGNDFAIDDITFTTSDTCRVSDTVIVTVNPKPVVNLGSDISTCAASADLTVPNTQPSWTYLWNNSATSNPITVNSNGTYSVEVTDANNCKGSDAIDVAFVSASKINLGNDTAFCSGGSKLLDAGAGYTTYAWTGAKAGSTQTMVADVAGTYYVEASGVCNSKDTIVVSINAKPIVNLGSDISTCGSSVNLTVTGAQPADAFVWSDGSLVNPITVNSSGTYSVEVTNTSNCVGRDTVVVNLVTALNVNLGNDTSFCAGGTKLLDAGAGYNSYLWTGAKTGSSQTMLADIAGTYVVNVTAGGGCSDADTIVVSINAKPTVNLGADITSCAASVDLHAQPNFTSYLWSDASSDSVLTVSSSGTYWVEVANASNCKSRDTINVSLGSNLVVDLGADASVCAGASKSLDAGVGFTSYAWSGAKSGSAQTLIADVAGAYYVTAYNGACAAKDTFILTVYQNPKPSLGNDVTICTGASALFDAGVFSSYLWSDASTLSTLNAAVDGTYWVEVTDGNLCQGRDTVMLTIQNTIAVNLGADINACLGDAPLLDAGNGFSSYTWDGAKSGSAQTMLADVAGQYIATVTSGGSCSASDTINVSFFNLPQVDLGADVQVCAGSTTSIDAGTFVSYLWSTAETSQSISKGVGVYSVEVTDANSCTDTDTIIVTSAALPQVNVGNDVTACEGEVLVVQDNVGQGGLTYDWSDGTSSLGNSSSLTITQSGTYTLTVTDPNNCKKSDAVNATFNTPPSVDLLGGTDTSIVCKGNNKILDATVNAAGIYYLWLPGKETSSTITVSNSGEYSVIISDGSCSDTDKVYIKAVSMPKSVLNDTFLPNNRNYCFVEEPNGVLISAYTEDKVGYKYLWSTGDTTATIYVTKEGTYSLTLSLDNCEVKDNLKLIDYCPTIINFPSAFSPNGDGVNETFYAKGVYVEDYQMLIFNRWGELIFTANSMSDAWDGTYGGVKVEHDVYVWKVLYTEHQPNGINSKKEKIGKVVVLR